MRLRVVVMNMFVYIVPKNPFVLIMKFSYEVLS